MANVYSPLVAGDRQTTLLPEFTVFKMVKFVKLYNKLCSSAVYQFAYTKNCNTRWILFFI